jgi:hypothetical protein
MATQKDIEFIAKLVARISMSDSAGEIEASLRGAIARMQRDGVTLEDVLTLDTQLLYQNGLTQLAEFMVKQRSDLSEPAKRELYSEYLQKIVERFTPRQNRSGQGSHESSRASQSGTTQEPPRRPYAEPPKRSPGESSFSFSPAAIFSASGLKAFRQELSLQLKGIFGAGGFLAQSFRSPKRAFILLCACSLFGLGIGLVPIIFAALLHAVFNLGGPWLDFQLASVWSILGSAAGLWKMRDLYQRGWF